MATTAVRTASPALHIARVPGELGPIVRCSGELTVATGEALKRQLDLLASLRLPTLTLNVSGCRSLDMDGALLLLAACKRMGQEGRRFAIVAGAEAPARVLALLGIDTAMPVFATEAAANEALRGGRPEPTGATRPEARDEALSMWRSILEALEPGSPDEMRRRISAGAGLCRQAEAVLCARTAREVRRCGLCPLLHALGAGKEHLACDDITLPMLDALFKEDRAAARGNVSRLIELFETMPPPQA
ncbi:MAG: STAS domain-containing protein [Actinomycetota bacterium]